MAMDFSPLFFGRKPKYEYDTKVVESSEDMVNLLEADDDGGDGGDSDGGNDESGSGDNGGGDNSGDSGGGDDSGTGDLDINISDSDMEGGGDDAGGDDSSSGGDSGGSSGGGDSPETQNMDPNSEAKQKDRETFDTLTPFEQKLKTVELKQLFMDLYDRCEQLIEKYDLLGVEYEDIKQPISASTSALFSIKNMVSRYLLYLFDTKTYYENDIQYNQFLVALNRVRLVSDQMTKAHKDQIEASKARPLNDKDIEQEFRKG